MHNLFSSVSRTTTAANVMKPLDANSKLDTPTLPYRPIPFCPIYVLIILYTH